MIDHFLGDALRVLSFQFWSTVLQTGDWLPIHTLNYWTVQLWCPVSNWGCVCVTLLIVDPWQSSVSFIRSVVTQCILLNLGICGSTVGYTQCSGRTSVHLCTPLL